MTEKDQLEALKAEYRARGLFVQADVPADQVRLGIKGVATLDLVGWGSKAMKGRPAVIVEIANRSRRLDGRKGSLQGEVWTDEAARLERFESLATAIRAVRASAPDAKPVEFVIRFFDVTADQTRARGVQAVNVRSADAIAAEVQRTRAALRAADETRRIEIGGATCAREWARWLRLLGRRFPARRRALPEADLRTIQKELHDRLVLPLSPARYKPMHAAILALNEGGDVDWTQFEELRDKLEHLLKWVERGMLVDVPARSTDTFERAEARIRQREQED